MNHPSSLLAVCGPSFSTYRSPSWARNLTVEPTPGADRTFKPLGPTPTTCTVEPMAKLPGGRVCDGGIVGSGGLGVNVGFCGSLVGLAGGPTVKVDVMAITTGGFPPAAPLFFT